MLIGLVLKINKSVDRNQVELSQLRMLSAGVKGLCSLSLMISRDSFQNSRLYTGVRVNFGYVTHLLIVFVSAAVFDFQPFCA